MLFEMYVWKLYGLDYDDKNFLKLVNKFFLLNFLWGFFVFSIY